MGHIYSILYDYLPNSQSSDHCWLHSQCLFLGLCRHLPIWMVIMHVGFFDWEEGGGGMETILIIPFFIQFLHQQQYFTSVEKSICNKFPE